ncbi:MAG: LamG domain-containing protein, partial [Sedimentisphaerales bacterium]
GPGPGGVPSLVGHWKMDDNAADTTVLDSSGRGNHGTAQRNTSALSTIGIIDGALTFDGTSDYIDCGSSAILQQKQTLTVSAWINGSSFAKPMNMIVCGDKRNLDFCWGLRIDNSVAKFFVRAGSYYAATGPTVSDNQWYHVVGVWDRNGGPNNLRIYVDGSLEGTATVNADMDADTVYVTIGRLYYPTVNQYFDGLIDDVRIYNRVLSDTEIAALP